MKLVDIQNVSYTGALLSDDLRNRIGRTIEKALDVLPQKQLGEGIFELRTQAPQEVVPHKALSFTVTRTLHESEKYHPTNKEVMLKDDAFEAVTSARCVPFPTADGAPKRAYPLPTGIYLYPYESRETSLAMVLHTRQGTLYAVFMHNTGDSDSYSNDTFTAMSLFYTVAQVMVAHYGTSDPALAYSVMDLPRLKRPKPWRVQASFDLGWELGGGSNVGPYQQAQLAIEEWRAAELAATISPSSPYESFAATT